MRRQAVGKNLGEWANLARSREQLIEIEPELPVMTRLEPEVAFATGYQAREPLGHTLW